ncbi:hypothetical protein ABW21_db0200693 [Orbilia brochopaga]|nr:hypothetical protein ABW21_db0200693 [Drechslerella brochopaga]
MAASHGTAIAKATLSAALLRADPRPVAGDEIARLHSLFDKCITICTPENIKTCKHWLLEHLVHSEQRVAAFGKYLLALSASLKSQAADLMTPSSRRRRLYILYLLNDTIHHTTFYSSPAMPFGKNIQPFLKELFSLAQDPARKKQQARLENLLSIWLSKGYFTESTISEWRDEVTYSFEPTLRDNDTTFSETRLKDAQAVLPALHGDPSAPYHDLPATTMLPLMRPNSPTPISTRSVKPIPMKAGPPSKELSAALNTFIKSVNKMWYGGDMRVLPDVDELGVDVIKAPPDARDDDISDDADSTRNAEECYYGWSRGFAIQMIKRRKGEIGRRSDDDSRERGRARSYSRSPYSPTLENAPRPNDQAHALPPPPPTLVSGTPQFPFGQQFPVPMQMPPEMAQFFQAGIPPPPPIGVTPPGWGNNVQSFSIAPGTLNAFSQWQQSGQGGMYNNPPPPPPPPGSGGTYGGPPYGGRGGYHSRGGWNSGRGSW